MASQIPIKTVRTSFDILKCLAGRDGATISELEKYLEMPRSTIYDYLRTFVEEGYVINDDGEYRLSLRLLDLVGQTRNNIDLFHTAKPELRALAESTSEHTNLVMEENGYGYVIFTASGGNMERTIAHVGARFALHAAAPGKAILANMPPERVDEIIGQDSLVSVTDSTITDRAELDAELDLVRERGYAIDDEEIVTGMRGIGAPIVDRNSETLQGAVSIYGPARRSDGDELIEELLKTANIIEVKITHQ